MLKKILLFFFIFPTLCKAQVIVDSIRADWSHAGFEGIIPDPALITDITAFGAIANDTIDDYPALLSAINSLNGNAGVVFIPSGVFKIHSPVFLPDSVIIRGNGSDSTVLEFNFNGTNSNCFSIQKSQTGTFTTLQSGYKKGSNKMILPGAATLFSSGDHIELRQANGSWDTNPAFWADFSIGHISQVDSVSGDTLWLQEALRIDFDSISNPEIRKIIPRTNCGLECFKMTRTDSLATSVNYGIFYYHAYNCWIRGVESYKSIGAHVWAEASSHLYISGCYFHESYIYDGAGTKGYGVIMSVHTCESLIENNIFKKLRHAMMVKQGANGNVYGYNYSIEPNRTEFPPNASGDLLLHGHYPFANLFEGNIAQNLGIDQVWGPSGPYNTFFRNRIELYGIVMTSGTVPSHAQNFVGNDVPNLATGLYLLNGTNHFEFGNNFKNVITPPGTSPLSDSSYYLDSVPSFWNIPQAFPAIGIPNLSSNENNPASQLFLNAGDVTLCGFDPDSIINVSLPDLPNHKFLLKNSFFIDHTLNMTFYSSVKEKLNISLFDLAGRRVLTKNISIPDGHSVIKIETKNLSGFYLIKIDSGKYLISSKIIKLE